MLDFESSYRRVQQEKSAAPPIGAPVVHAPTVNSQVVSAPTTSARAVNATALDVTGTSVPTGEMSRPARLVLSEAVVSSGHTEEPESSDGHREEPVLSDGHPEEPESSDSRREEPVLSDGHMEEPESSDGRREGQVEPESSGGRGEGPVLSVVQYQEVVPNPADAGDVMPVSSEHTALDVLSPGVMPAGHQNQGDSDAHGGDAS